MKIVVISDTHGNIDVIQDVIRKHNDADIYLHLGDSELPEYLLDRFVSVNGNCDRYSSYPDYRIIKTPMGNIYAEHGYLHYSVDEEFLKEKNCFMYLSGHTHCHKDEIKNGYYFFNPGSLTRPRDGTSGTYLVLEISEKKVKYKFYNL